MVLTGLHPHTLYRTGNGHKARFPKNVIYSETVPCLVKQIVVNSAYC